MGLYRFILSIMVLLSHSGVYYYGFNQGIIAVVAFLIISGYTTDISLERRLIKSSVKEYKKFILDRVVRILPQYWFHIVLTLIVVSTFNLNHETIKNINFKAVILNLLLLPLDYKTLFNSIDKYIVTCNIIPAAWTIGMQFTYYLIAPFLYNKEKHGKKEILNYIIFGCSFIIFLMSITNIINADYSYVLLPGTLWIFMIGTYIRRENSKYFLYCVSLISIFIFLYIGRTGLYINGHSREILFGVFIGIPIICCLKLFPRTKIDDLLGNISFGIYLNHFTLKTIMINIIGHEPNNIKERIILVLISALLAFVSYYLVEYPLKHIRIFNFKKKLN